MTHLLKPLTKYPFLKARDCIKSLYLHYHWPGLKGPSDDKQALKYSIGNKVGKVGQQIYPNGIDLTEDGKIWGMSLLEKTQEALSSRRKTLYEALFTTPCKQFSCRVDILHREENENIVVEVKSSTAMKFPEHLLDIGFQYMILNQVLNDKPLKIYIAHLNKDYKRKGEIDTKKLFNITDMTEPAIKVQPIIENYINIFSDVLKDQLPYENSVGPHCTQPNKCPFYEHCWKDIPKYSVFNISRIKKTKAQELLESGIASPDQISDGHEFSKNQQIEIECYTKRNTYINKTKILKFFEGLETDKPIYFLDFETLAPPVPLYEGTSCYQHLCFQYSLIKKDSDKKWKRMEFLADPGKDPRLSFTENLLHNTKDEGKIIVYNKAFEITRLRELAHDFPIYRKEINERISRVVDLMKPFVDHDFYHPHFQGNFSLKNILPVMCPEYEGYSKLKIKDGVAAMQEYENLGGLSLQEQNQSRRALKDYCYTDTFAMIKILQQLVNECLN